MYVRERKLEHVEYQLLAISKGWVKKIDSYPDLLDSLIEAYHVEYADMIDRPAYAAKIFVQRWLELNHYKHYFNITTLLEKMEPNQLVYLGYPNDKTIPYESKMCYSYEKNYDAGLYGNFLKAITSQLSAIRGDDLPGFHQWLIDNGYEPRSTPIEREA